MSSTLADWMYVLVYRTPRRPSKSISKTPIQRVEIVRPEELYQHLFPGGPPEGALEDEVEKLVVDENLLLIPVGPKFEDVRKRLKILFDLG